MKVNRVVIALLLGVCLALVLSQPALAGLSVSGAKVEAEVAPGSDYTAKMIVGNTSDIPMDIAVEARGYGTSPASSFAALKPGEDNSPYSAQEFLSISPASFILKPGESKDIIVTIRVPADVGDGGRYAIVFIHTVPSGGGGIAVVTAIAARVLLTIAGSNLITDSAVTEVSLAVMSSPQSLAVMVTVANRGNYHYMPQIQGKIRVGDRVVASSPPMTASLPVIPGYLRQFKLDFVTEEPLLPGKYEVDIEVRDEAGRLVVEHTSTLELAEEQKPPPEEQKLPPEEAPSGVTIAPRQPEAVPPQPLIDWRLIGEIVVGVVVVGILIYLLATRERRKQY